jgi:hypothetical protein
LVTFRETLYSQKEGDACSRFFGANTKSKAPIAADLSDQEAEQVADRRACIKSYGLPGGAENLKDLSSDELLRDKLHLQSLFDKYAGMRAQGLSNEDILRRIKKDVSINTDDAVRLIRMAGGWDRNQVTLYGEWLYIRKLGEEGKYSKCATVAMEAMKKFRLSLQQAPKSRMDEHTYFSTQALGNMIILELVGAKAATRSSSIDDPADLSLLVSFLDNRSALEWQFEFTGGDPSDRWLETFSGLYDRVAVGEDGEPRTTVAKSSYVAGYFSEGTNKITLVRGNRIYGLLENDGDVKLLEPREVALSFRTFCRKEVQEKSTDQMRLFAVNNFGKGYEVDVGTETISVNEAEFALLQKGTALAESHPLTQRIRSLNPTEALVMYTHPLMLRRGPLQTKADNFAFVLAKAYPEARIYRDEFSSRTAGMVAGLQRFNTAGPQDLYAVIADDSFGVQDYKIVQNIKGDLTKAGVSLISFTQLAQPPWGQGKGKGLIVITGHIDSKLAGFINALGEKGYFEGNYVLFNSCRSPLTRTLISQINTTFKAAATFSFDSKIKVASVEDFLVDFTSKLQAEPAKEFDIVLRQSSRAAHLNGIWTVCFRYDADGERRLLAMADEFWRDDWKSSKFH